MHEDGQIKSELFGDSTPSQNSKNSQKENATPTVPSLTPTKLNFASIPVQGQSSLYSISDSSHQSKNDCSKPNEIHTIGMKNAEVQCNDNTQIDYANLIKDEQNKRSETIAELTNKLNQSKAELNEEQRLYENMFKEAEKNIEYRKKLVAQIHKLKGNIRAYCRVKPNQSEKSVISYPESFLNFSEFTTLLIGKDKKPFMMDRVFTEKSTQQDVFNEVFPFIQSALDGSKVSIFAYGPTGSGKTYTMVGKENCTFANNKEPTEFSGILPRAGIHIFNEIERVKQLGGKYEVLFSCIEIYNDSIRDLLSNEDNIEIEGNKLKSQKFVQIDSHEKLISQILYCNEHRVTDKTRQNDYSSRSHCIYTLNIKNVIGQKEQNGILSIIDLAGSERADKTASVDMSETQLAQMKKIQNEANYINKSLTSLGRVITMLTEKKNMKKGAICYRDSKLTRILQSTLQPDSKTLMFVNINSDEKSECLSKSALGFAQKASLIPK